MHAPLGLVVTMAGGCALPARILARLRVAPCACWGLLAARLVQ